MAYQRFRQTQEDNKGENYFPYHPRFTADGIISSVTFAPWLGDYAKRCAEALQEKELEAKKAFEDVNAALEIMTDEQLTAGVFYAPYNDQKRRDVGRFFLQELMRRDTCKALKVFSVWKSGGTLEDLNL